MKTLNSARLSVKTALFGGALCAGAILLIPSSAKALNQFEAPNTGGAPNALTFDGAGNLFEASGNSIIEITPGGVQSTFASGVFGINGLAFNNAGNLFVSSGNSIIEITPGGVRSTFASGLRRLGQLTFDSGGDLFTTIGSKVYEITPDGTQSVFASGLHHPSGLTFNSADDLFVENAGRIYEYTPAECKVRLPPGCINLHYWLLAARATCLSGMGTIFTNTHQAE